MTTEKASSGASPAERLVVLHVDDDEQARQRVEELLAARFPTVGVRGIVNHVDFYRAVKKKGFDLVISEEALHWATGSEVAAAVKKVCPSIPVIVYSAVRDEEAAARAVEAGAIACLCKWDAPESTLIPAVRSALKIVEYADRASSFKERLTDVLNSLGIAVFRSSMEGRLLEANGAFLQLLGFKTLEEAQAADLHALYVQSGVRVQLLERLLEEGQVRDFQAELRRVDGSTVWVALTETCVSTDGEKAIEGVGVDVTLQRREQTALAQSNEQYRAIFETTSAATVIVDEDGTVSLVNSAFESLSGFTRAEVEDCKLFTELVGREDMERVRELHRLRRQGSDQLPASHELHLVGRDRQTLQVRASEALLPGTQLIVVSLLDLTSRRKLEEQLLHQAFNDSLTGLPNRYALLDRLDDLVAGGGPAVSLLVLDLDRFKAITDSLGYARGDELLKAVARRLRATLPDVAVLARVGGATFAAAVESAADAGGATTTADAVRAALSRPLAITGHEIFSTASVGIALSTQVKDADCLLRAGEAAMQRAKALGGDRCEVFVPALLERASELFLLENDLRRALAGDELRLHYQPIVSLASGRVVAVDAFVRWQHPERGLLYPDAFLPLADETGLMVQVGRRVLVEVCRQLSRWAAIDPALFATVQVSRRQLAYPDIEADAREFLAETGMPAERLVLSASEETLLADPDVAIEALGRLGQLGFQLGIDGFGTGASLGLLHRLPVTTLRIARSFLKGIGEDADRWRIVEALHGLGRHLGRRVVVAGVDEGAQLKRLLAMGCELGQGKVFSPPVEAEVAADILKGAGSEKKRGGKAR